MTAPITIHFTRTTTDHTRTVTMCGLSATTDRQAVSRAQQEGPWVSCPLCEAALALAGIPAVWEPDRIGEGRGNPSWI